MSHKLQLKQLAAFFFFFPCSLSFLPKITQNKTFHPKKQTIRLTFPKGLAFHRHLHCWYKNIFDVLLFLRLACPPRPYDMKSHEWITAWSALLILLGASGCVVGWTSTGSLARCWHRCSEASLLGCWAQTNGPCWEEQRIHAGSSPCGCSSGASGLEPKHWWDHTDCTHPWEREILQAVCGAHNLHCCKPAYITPIITLHNLMLYYVRLQGPQLDPQSCARCYKSMQFGDGLTGTPTLMSKACPPPKLSIRDK